MSSPETVADSGHGRGYPAASGDASTWLLLVGLCCPISCLIACGSDPEQPAIEEPQADAGVDDISVPDFPSGDEVDADAAWLERQCELLCLREEGCGESAGASCVQDCLDGDGDDVAALSCRLSAECGQTDRCADAIPADRNCPALCELVSDCDGFPSVQWGRSEIQCVQACNGYAHARPDRKQEEINCYGRLLQDSCRLDDVGQCRLDTGPDDACAQICGRLTQECRAIPGETFLTLGECLDGCRALDDPAERVLNNCISVAGCDRHPRCWPPASTTPDGCGPFCDSLLAKCPGAGLNDATCADACTGFHQALPGGAYAESPACIDAFDTCPEGDAIFACILPEYDGCTDICGALEACGADVTQCDIGCRSLVAAYPQDIETVRDCAVDAACAQLGTCFQGLEN